MNRRILSILIAILTFSLTMFSCEDDTDQKQEAYGDVLSKSIIKGDSVVYGIYYYTYSWSKMKGVTVNRLNQTDYITLDSMDYKYTFVHNPTDSELSIKKPKYGTFRFNVEFEDGDTVIVSDYLDSTFLQPVELEEISFDVTDGQLKIDWKETPLADTYRVALIDEKNELAYQSDILGPKQSYMWLNMYSSGWQASKQPKGGEKYRISVAAYQFEPVASSFDVQSISWNDTAKVVWTIFEED